MCDEFFDQQKQRFPLKCLGEVKMHTGCTFGVDWDNITLEMNQTAFAKTLVQHYNISTTSNIPGGPGVDLRPRKAGEPWVNEEYPQ